MKQAQTGVALLTILLLVVAIVVIAGSMLASQKVMVREYQLTQNQQQFNEYAMFGEAIAKQLIIEDSQVNQTDSLQDVWSQPIKPQTIDQAEIGIQIQDNSQFFNINNLYHDGAVDNHAVAYFTALLMTNGVEPAIAQAVLDWQDPDSDVAGEGGAEFDYYQSLGKKIDTPFAMTIANQPFMSVDELLYVRGMDKEKLSKIKHLLVAVPFYLPMNVNTMPAELISVIGLINHTQTNSTSNNASATASTPTATDNIAEQISQIDPIALAQWIDERQTAIPIQDIDKFWALPMLNSITTEQKQVMANLLAVESHAFTVITTVTMAEKQRYFSSQLAKIANTEQTTGNNLTTLSQNNGQATRQVVAYQRQILPFLPKK